jgi:hypothetical protein
MPGKRGSLRIHGSWPRPEFLKKAPVDRVLIMKLIPPLSGGTVTNGQQWIIASFVSVGLVLTISCLDITYTLTSSTVTLLLSPSLPLSSQLGWFQARPSEGDLTYPRGDCFSKLLIPNLQSNLIKSLLAIFGLGVRWAAIYQKYISLAETSLLARSNYSHHVYIHSLFALVWL